MYFRSQEQVFGVSGLLNWVRIALLNGLVDRFEFDIMHSLVQTLAHDSHSYYQSQFNGTAVEN